MVGKIVKTNDRLWIKLPDHPKANKNGWVQHHVWVVEEALGKPLPPGAEVHHVDGRGNNNINSNLVACQDKAYHMLLEQRTRAYNATGHASWLRCPYCKTYDNPSNLYVKSDGVHARHPSCFNQYQLEFAAKRYAAGWRRDSRRWYPPSTSE